MKKKQLVKYGLLLGIVILLLTGGAWLFLRTGLSSMDAPPGTPAVPSSEEYWPTENWQTSTPEEQGFDSTRLAEALQTLHKKNYAIDSLMIIRNGHVLLDAYFYPYDGSFPHDLASITKSFTTTLIAIAASQGRVDLDQPVVSYFPDRQIDHLDELKQSLTVRELAGMVNGMDSECLSGDEDKLKAMRSQADWVQAALDRPMKQEPGRRFCYDSPGMHILSAILQETTGMTELEFAQQNLFEPLGIEEVYWEVDPQGYNRGWGDLHLKPRDAAKLGYLWLHQGAWDGKQIVPAAWVEDSVKPKVKTGEGDSYGYGWWVSKNNYSAIGRNGQHVTMYPALNLIVVTTAGDFDYEVLDRLLGNAFIDPVNSLPANPEGLAILDTQLTEISHGVGREPATSLPDTALAISGKIYICDTNPGGVQSLRFEFNGLQTANMYMEQNNADVVWPIGLEGEYQLTTTGEGVRGWWEDEQTFIVDLFDIGQLKREFHFNGDKLSIYVPEVPLTIHCQVQNP